jgi:hypothetical protein
MGIRTKILISALVGSASLAVAMPAQAQDYDRSREWRVDRHDDRDDRYDRRERDDDNDRYERRDRHDDRYQRHDRYDDRGQVHALRNQIEQLERRVARIDRRDRISEREAVGLRRAVWSLRQQHREFSRNGLTRREAQVLQYRIQQVRQRIAHELHDRDGRRW